MKKFFILALCLIFAPQFVFGYSFSITPNTQTLTETTTVPVTILTSLLVGDEEIYFFDLDGNYSTSLYETNPQYIGLISEFFASGVGEYKAVYGDGIVGDCGGTYVDCAIAGEDLGTVFTVTNSVIATGLLFHFTSPTTGDPSDSPTDLLASVGSVSTDVIKSAGGWISLAIGVLVAFYLAITLVPLVIPKEKKEKNKKQ